MRSQFAADLDDWLDRRGPNLFASSKMISKCSPELFGYWEAWLRAQRTADGLAPHVDEPPLVA
jgi:hypothetical protein